MYKELLCSGFLESVLLGSTLLDIVLLKSTAKMVNRFNGFSVFYEAKKSPAVSTAGLKTRE
ncbi:hypothetical protein MED121_22532 [Marinomonas sp. MED121]|nr:hypothetical protein MED121_22532 [Marinomonas sp. MED121]